MKFLFFFIHGNYKKQIAMVQGQGTEERRSLGITCDTIIQYKKRRYFNVRKKKLHVIKFFIL